MNSNRKVVQPRRADYMRALESMGTFMDIGIDDLMTLAQRAEDFARQRVTEKIIVSHIMSHPVCVVHPETLISEAVQLMLVERISGLPVVDDSDKIVGIITVADVLRGHGVPAHYPVQQSWQRLGSIFRRLNHYADRGEPDDPVDEFMIHEVVCVSPGHDIQKVLNLMKCHLVKRLIVCDEERHVAGIVTRSDLMRIFFGITP